MLPLNTAQRLLMSLGVDPVVLIAHERDRTFQTRKAGPGRKSRHGAPGNRIAKERPQRAYVALMRHFAGKRTGEHSLA